MAGGEIEMASMERREDRLKIPLQEVKDNYDYIIIDCLVFRTDNHEFT